MQSLIQMMGKLSAPGIKCSFPNCSCHSGSDSIISLKACAACDIVGYCCKQSQTSDWRRHKKMCIGFRHFKDEANLLNNQQKSALNSISLELPSIAEEYLGKYGSGIHILMHTSYIDSALKATRDMVYNNIIDLTLDGEKTQRDLLKRWQEISPNLFEFIENAKIGDIFLKNTYASYQPGAPQQFRNTPLSEPAVLKNGTTVIDIGFVDFGIAFDSIDSIDFKGSPVTVFGYEMEPFCVAKSMVMMEMIKDVDVNTRSVVEVWLSSLWSKSTLHAFKKATRSVLHSTVTIEEKVERIVQFWNQSQKMTSKSALQFQIQAVMRTGLSDFAMDCCSLALQEDRVRFLRYFLTKALYEDETTTVGSVVMNFVNEAIGVNQLFANCFETAPSRIHSRMDPSFKSNSNIVDRTISYFEKNMSKFIRHVRKGTLIFTPKFGVVSGCNQAMIQEIKKKRPYIISWSNVIDYIAPTEFHTIAKQISCKETAHYLHSCNWTSRVYGADIYDINQKVRLYYYSGGLHLIEKGLAFFYGFTRQGVYHFRDVCTTVLGRNFCNRFFKYFFANQDVKCSCFNGNTPLKLPFPFARNVSTAFIIFAYEDTGIEFGQDTYNYMSD